jgi:hypothetical protein
MAQGIFSGIAAEYFVAAELSRRGFTASITLKNTPGIDILAAAPGSSKPLFVQVKAKDHQGKKPRWLLNKANEGYTADNYFYAFVSLNNKTLAPPDIYLVPAETVAARIKANHQQFLAKGGNDNPLREFIITDGAYLNNWDILR